MDELSLTPTKDELAKIFAAKYDKHQVGWGPKMRLAFEYFTPDDYYECLVNKLVRPGVAWADVGCGRDIFPSNSALAETLAKRCGYLFGIDPDPNIRENTLLHEHFEGPLEGHQVSNQFDLVTLRMVAEHIAYPEPSVRKIAELLKPSGVAVVYTPNRWSPVPVVTALVPNRFHYRLRRLVTNVQERDVFPTRFLLNTRADLHRYFAKYGLSEMFFAYVDDCQTFSGFRVLNYMELGLQRILRGLSIRYPENCLIGVYQKAAPPVAVQTGRSEVQQESRGH